ncbi:HAMP domain-containing sensor histidine kinase [Pseudoalteromonas sp. TB64]|uniref:sensor histidine kinase n=1 Tax=Pseudoalteromonas sp. TB64 TaxID=1938600 RepID=UPI00040619B6|nr:HAMP domain-containing sensor histidine kinase [Pseudoalteromonas sp. TB64]
MPKKVHQSSIRKALINLIMLITAICLSLSISISTYLSVKEQKQLIINKLVILSVIVAFDAGKSVADDDRKTEEKRLKSFDKIPLIKNIHIYTIEKTSQKPVFFISFNAKKTPPVPLRIDSVNDLAEPHITNEYIELIRPISHNEKLIGYVYMRGSLESLDIYIKHKILIDMLLTLLILVVVYFIAVKTQKRIAKPIEHLSMLLQDVSKNHNYDARAPITNVKEITVLSNSLNIMLARTQKQLTRHEKDKEEIKQLNQSLEEKVNQRTIALREANQELLSTLERMHQYQTQIVENEKMASLGQMVAGVAHEVNTPIGLGITGSTLLRDKLADIQISFNDQNLTSNQLKRFIDEGIENLDLIYRNLNRAADLIANFKKVAVIQDDGIKKSINLHKLISDVLTSVQSELITKKPIVTVNCPTDLLVQSKSDPLQQVFQQLLINSVVHGFIGTENNEIKIDVELTDKKLTIIYSDNGQGVDKNVKHRIFDPFVTSKRGQGASGLGMHLVYNLVTQALGGRILFDLEEKHGARFIITIP